MIAIPVDKRLVPNGQEGVRYTLQHLSAQNIFTPHGWNRVLIEDKLDEGGAITIRYAMATANSSTPNPTVERDARKSSAPLTMNDIFAINEGEHHDNCRDNWKGSRGHFFWIVVSMRSRTNSHTSVFSVFRKIFK